MQKAFEICFASLPSIRRVEVVHLASLDVRNTPRSMDGARDAPRVRLEGEAAQSIAQLWRELPPGSKGIRCHYPHFGIRFYKQELLELEASLCWKCHNIFGESNKARVSAEFDSEHPKAQALLALLRKVWNEQEHL